ncbi:MAG: hypothetical protein Q9160_008618 [Pyrenula sp. 1 TL-2023]
MSKAHPLGSVMECAAKREYFYVGGQYTDGGTGFEIFKDQIYVERLVPPEGRTKSDPILFIHGNAQTGTENWLNKPDGSPGWASYFISHGYEVYIVDQTSRGRSPWQPGSDHLQMYPWQFIEKRFTAIAKHSLWPQAVLHNQWPGSGSKGDPYFDAYYGSCVPSVVSAAQQQMNMKKAGGALLDRIGKPVVLVGHSQGGIHAWLFADSRPNLVKCIVSLEPTGPPFREVVFSHRSARPYGLTDIPITYDPPVNDPEKDLVKQSTSPPSTPGMQAQCYLQAEDAPRQLIHLREIPVLLLTAEASYHALYDSYTVAYLRQAGVKVSHLELSKVNVHGNGHMMFLEKNSDEIANLIRQWLEQGSPAS